MEGPAQPVHMTDGLASGRAAWKPTRGCSISLAHSGRWLLIASMCHLRANWQGSPCQPSWVGRRVGSSMGRFLHKNFRIGTPYSLLQPASSGQRILRIMRQLPCGQHRPSCDPRPL